MWFLHSSKAYGYLSSKDDNLASQQVLREMLEALRFQVTVVGSGEQALETVLAVDEIDPFGLILMDWRMPGIDGITATKLLRSDRRIRNLCPIILMSASGGGAGERQAAIEAVDFLPKPLTSSTLVDALLRIYAPELIAAANHSGAEAHKEKPLEGTRIPTEDNEINQQIAQELLTQAGADVTVASNGNALRLRNSRRKARSLT